MSNETNSTAFSNAPVEGFVETTRQFARLGKSRQAPDVRRPEFIPGPDPTGPYPSLVEEYLTTFVPSCYKPSTVLSLRRSLELFFQFVVGDQQITERKEAHVQ
jgi:hypothetical protein